MVTVEQGMKVVYVDHSEQLPDSISASLLFVCCCLFCVCLCVFFYGDSSMISIGTIKFRYFAAIIIPVNLGKP